MSQSLDTEKDIDEDILKSIDKTVEAEAEFYDYIEEERHRRRNKSSSNKLDSNDDESKNWATSQYDAKVEHIQKFKEVFKITYNIDQDTQNSQSIPVALPEDTGSKWVRLCKWAGVDPEHPTKLMGKTIPVDDNGNINFPPKKERLNPLKFKFEHGIKKFYENPTWMGINIEKVIPVLGLISGLIITAVMLATVLTTSSNYVFLLSLPTAAIVGTIIGKSINKIYKLDYNIGQKISQFLFPK